MSSNNSKYIQLDYLELMTQGDTEMKATMMEMLADEIPTEILKMRDCATEQNWAEIREISHKLKTTLAFTGNEAMQTANREIEMLAKSNTDCERIPELLIILEELYPFVVEELLRANG